MNEGEAYRLRLALQVLSGRLNGDTMSSNPDMRILCPHGFLHERDARRQAEDIVFDYLTKTSNGKDN